MNCQNRKQLLNKLYMVALEHLSLWTLWIESIRFFILLTSSCQNLFKSYAVVLASLQDTNSEESAPSVLLGTVRCVFRGHSLSRPWITTGTAPGCLSPRFLCGCLSCRCPAVVCVRFSPLVSLAPFFSSHLARNPFVFLFRVFRYFCRLRQ